jgi:hypothetical protein
MPFGDGNGPRNSRLKNCGGRNQWLRCGVKTSDEGLRGQGQGRRKFCSMGRRSCYKRNQLTNA